MSVLTIMFASFAYTAVAQTSADEINNDLPDVPVQSVPIVATESNSPADSGISINEESVDTYYGKAGTKVITTNVTSPKVIAYPNPTVDYINVIMPDIATNRIHAYLHDLQGARILSYVFAPGGNQISIDMTSLPEGMYNLRIFEEGYNMQMIRIVKNR